MQCHFAEEHSRAIAPRDLVLRSRDIVRLITHYHERETKEMAHEVGGNRQETLLDTM